MELQPYREPGGYSGHATEVARILDGHASKALCYKSSDWSTRILEKYSDAPVNDGSAVVNHSWVSGSASAARKMWMRVDWLVEQGQIHVVGLANDDAFPLVMANPYNVITVGVSDGSHSRGGTIGDVPDRQKPDVTVDDPWTSFATPKETVLCLDLIREFGWSPLQVKAAIMCSATRGDNWTQAESKPLDDILGAGEIHPERARNVNFGTEVNHTGGEFCAVLTWHRHITTPNGWNEPEASFEPMTLELVGIETTQAGIDNVALIRIKDLPTGEYQLEIEGEPDNYALAWI